MRDIQTATQQNLSATQQTERAAQDLSRIGLSLMELVGSDGRAGTAPGMNRGSLAARLLAAFLEDLEEQLRAMDADLLALEAHPADGERLRSLFRVAHTVKGAARAAAVPLVEEACHALEARLAEVRDGGPRAGRGAPSGRSSSPRTPCARPGRGWPRASRWRARPWSGSRRCCATTASPCRRRPPPRPSPPCRSRPRPPSAATGG
jgi:two-component system chemotaxis sensor kinase CheA